MRSAVWYRAYLIANVPLVIAIFVFLPYHTFLWGTMGLGATVAVAIGALRNKPGRRLPWILVAIGLACFISGDITYDVLTKYLGEKNPFPSLADVFYLLTPPLLASGVVLMVRARRAERDLGALLDALTVTAGAALLSWIYLIQPYVHASGLTLVQKVVAIDYPLGDILIGCVVARLLLAGGLRNIALGLLSAGAVGLLAADCIYGWIQLNGTWKVGGPTDLGWVALYVLWGAAALHPSAHKVTERQPPRPHQLSLTSLIVLSLATLIAPLLLVWRAAFSHKVNDAGVIGGVAALMFVLVMARLSGLARSQAALARREKALREVGEGFVVATDVGGILDAALGAIGAIVGAAATVCLATELTDGGEVVVAANRPHLLKARIEVDDALGRGGPLCVTLGTGGPVPGTGPAAEWISVPLSSRGGHQRRLLAALASRLPAGTATVLDGLGAQVTLALERAELTRALHRRVEEARFRSLIQNASEVILVTYGDGRLSAETPSVSAILGYPPDVIASMTLAQLLHPDEAVQAVALIGSVLSGARAGMVRSEWRVRHADGSWLDMEVIINDLSNDAHIGGAVLTLRDVSDRKRLEGELRHRAFHDTLTGLANRDLFNDRVDNAISRMERQHSAVSVLILDLDDFKLVNDTLGHVAGDELLVEVGRRLKGCLREGDSAARLGGDEFGVCTENEGSGSARGAQGLAERILVAFRGPFPVAGTEVLTSVSIGVSVAKAGTSSPVDLLREADLALYAAKGGGKDTFRFFEKGLQDAASARLAQRGALEIAIANNQFCLHYQPIVRLSDRSIVGVEALLRWEHPERGLVPPDEFIPLAEESGLIVPLGSWVLDQACADLKRWSASDGRAAMLNMAVNVSPRQLSSANFLETVEAALLRHGVSPEALTLEITEGVFVQDDQETLAALQGLAQRGIAIALDDFGTGYSALSYLNRFPLRTLKIDRAFVAEMREPSGVALIDAIIAMARSLSLDVIAEGIELESQAQGLEGLACQYGQGFLFARPMPAAAFEALLEKGPLALNRRPFSLAAVGGTPDGAYD